MRKDPSSSKAAGSAKSAKPAKAAEPAEEAAPVQDAVEEGEVQLTRAERRAKGKPGQPKAHGAQHFVPKNANAHSQRIWANRRAG